MFFYRWRIALLALGTVLGYGLGIHSMHRSEAFGPDAFGARHGREAFERHVAEVCIGAANSMKSPSPPTAP